MSKKSSLVKKLVSKNKKFRFCQKLSVLTDNEISEYYKTAGKSILYTKEWKTLRNIVLDTYGRKCHKCKRTEDDGVKINVDHIKPRKYYPELALDFNNLQVLCGRCNKEKGNKNTNDYR